MRSVVGPDAAVGATIEGVSMNGEWVAVHIDGNRSVVLSASHRWPGEDDLLISAFDGDPEEEAAAMCNVGIMSEAERSQAWVNIDRKRRAQREAHEKFEYERLKAKFEGSK